MTTFSCDGCNKLFKGEPERISAKEWDINVCPSPYERECGGCDYINCKYNIEAEVCIEFYFCRSCSKKKSVIDKIFNSVEKF